MPPYSAQIVTGYDIVPVVPSDDPLPGGPCRALWIGGAGLLTITTVQGLKRTGIAAQPGLFPIQCSHVHETALQAATGIWAIY